MIRRTLTTAALCALPAIAQAADIDAMLERLENASEAAAEELTDFYRERLPEYEDKIPDLSWGEPMREANRCILRNIEAAGGDAAVTEYVEANETWAEYEITTLRDIGEEMPPVLLSELVAQLGQSCGASAITVKKIESSGFGELMRQPDMAERLM